MDTAQARQRLDAEKARLEEVRAAADRLATGAKEAADTELSNLDQHPAEQGTELMERELDEGVVQHAEAELAEVEAAIQRLDDGGYGRCETCGKAIGDERLDFIPATRFCVDDAVRAGRDPRSRMP